MTKFMPHIETLPAPQQNIWPQLSPVSQRGFVLYGGTALALQLAHRVSVDFDFFSSQPFQHTEIFKLLPFLKGSEIEKSDINTLSIRTQDDVKISFFGDISFGRVGNPLTCADNGIQVASLDDLMSTKLKVLFDRCASKDYVDLSAMIQAGVSVAKGLSSAREMFGSDFQPVIALKAMTCFEGGDLNEVSKKDRAILITASRKVGVIPPSRILSYELSSSHSQSLGKRI